MERDRSTSLDSRGIELKVTRRGEGGAIARRLRAPRRRRTATATTATRQLPLARPRRAARRRLGPFPLFAETQRAPTGMTSALFRQLPRVHGIAASKKRSVGTAPSPTSFRRRRPRVHLGSPTRRGRRPRLWDCPKGSVATAPSPSTHENVEGSSMRQSVKGVVVRLRATEGGTRYREPPISIWRRRTSDSTPNLNLS